MNPSYMAYNKAFLATIMNTLMGIEPPEPKGKQLNQTDGKLFAAKNGNGDEINNSLQDKMEKEAEVRAHLDKLAAEARGRANGVGYPPSGEELPYVKEMEDYGAAAAQKAHADYIVKQIILNRKLDLHTGREYLPDEPDPIHFPRSDIIVLAEEEQERRDRIAFNTEANAKVMTALYGSDNGVKIGEIHNKPDYPYSDMVREAEEAQAEAEAHVPLSDRIANPHWMPGQQRDVDLANAKASKACVHSGECANLNYENYTNEAL